MNPILIEIGPISIYWYSLTMLFAILVGSYIFLSSAKKKGYDEKFLSNLIFYGIIFGIIGARIYYVIFNLDYYLKDPIQIIEIWNGGLAIHGAIIAGAIWFIYYCKKNKKNFLKIFDLAAPALIISQAIGRWGNFFNAEAHGPEVAKETLESLNIPSFIIDGMNIGGKYYHPTFYYESIWNLIGFVVLIILRKKLKLKTGQLTGIYFMWYSVIRFFIESLRTDSLMLGELKVAQVVSVLLFILGLYLVIRKKKDTRVNRLKERTEENER